MDTFAKLAAAERQPYLAEAASRRDSTATVLEKDFWVCWTLKHLFALPEVPELRFKGGTSLSKVFNLIQRFSEDIDVSLNRGALGFSGERDLANPGLSITQRKKLEKELRAAITDQVTNNILPKLHKSFSTIIGNQEWTLTASDEPGDEMTILFAYPPAFEYPGYLTPKIKIEFGRGDQEPSGQFPVTPFAAEQFPTAFANPSALVGVLDCERTFWEKVTLLHAENHRPDPSKLKARMSRHWSDVAVMSTASRFADPKLSLDLLTKVVVFKRIYFAANWAHYETAVPGTLSIVPNESLQKVLRNDYKQMEEMFPNNRLQFDEILARLETLQSRINALEKPHTNR
jgi:hypothetical protein